MARITKWQSEKTKNKCHGRGKFNPVKRVHQKHPMVTLEKWRQLSKQRMLARITKWQSEKQKKLRAWIV